MALEAQVLSDSAALARILRYHRKDAEYVSMLDRRGFLAACCGWGAGALAFRYSVVPAIAAGHNGLDAAEFGVVPGTSENLNKAFARMLQAAADHDMPVYLPPGDYVVSGLTLPRRVRLAGVPGATRIIHGGGSHFIFGEDAEHVEFAGLALEGADQWLGDGASALVDLRRVRRLVIDNCSVTGSSKHAIALEQASGRIERSTISGAADAAIYSVDGARLWITGNAISDCGDGGILVHRWQDGEDGTMVTGNRIERIAARAGGTGQNGNGINIYRADNVVVSGNIVTDCAFSAVRANSASNIQITGNTCLRSGETAIYAEFSFEGAVINSNVVDGAASGISIVNFNEGGRLAVCSGNLIRNLSTSGPYKPDPPGFGSGISVEADCSVTGNVIENAPLHGIGIGWGEFMRNVVASGNLIRKSGRGIAISVVEGTGSAVVTDNVINHTERGAIVGHRWGEVVTGDLAVTGAADYSRLTIERNQAN